MSAHDFHDLPKVRDSLSYLYLEHCRIEQEAQAIAIYDQLGKTPVPVASLTLLMLGPGTSISHAAIKALADNGCLAMWCGEEGVRYYAQGLGETRSAAKLLQQATLSTNETSRLEVVKRMYRMRFSEQLPEDITIEQLRGREGIRVRSAYAAASKASGVEWKGRNYERGTWDHADPVNRALSSANACLYGICHAAIVSAGYSTALGFIHTGKQLSFVYDIADLYKTELTIPLAFQSVAANPSGVERTVRLKLRDAFRARRILERIIPDIETALDLGGTKPAQLAQIEQIDFEADPALPAPLWNPELKQQLDQEAEDLPW